MPFQEDSLILYLRFYQTAHKGLLLSCRYRDGSVGFVDVPLQPIRESVSTSPRELYGRFLLRLDILTETLEYFWHRDIAKDSPDLQVTS